jgi:hypothetical protein
LSGVSISGILRKNSYTDYFKKKICEVTIVEIQLTSDQVLALAPDSSSAKAGKKLGSSTADWKLLGMNAEALWGECQGSGKDPYQVFVELASLTSQCSCPSRKLPCKHSLGLLLLASASKVTEAEPPEWVEHVLEKRRASQVRKQERIAKIESGTPSASQEKTAEKRLASVKKGLDTLDIWLNDLMRQGLANVQTQPESFWTNQAARLRDAKAGALDTRVRTLADIPNASPDWPERLLGELGKIALLTHAFRLEDQLEPGMRETVRQLIGWTMTLEEVGVYGEKLQDDWLVLGQRTEESENDRKVQRTWLIGLRSKRPAMILQISVAGQPFAEHFAPGSHQEAELAFWPGAYPLRAYMHRRLGEIASFSKPLPGTESIDAFLESVAEVLNLQPWQERFLCILRNVTPTYRKEQQSWYICDSAGKALPFIAENGWLLLARSGGQPMDLAAEWDGEHLFPF